MVQQVILTGIWHNTTKKDGTPYKTKDGRAYEQCVLQDKDGKIYGFANPTTKSWKKGDTIEVEVEPSNGFRRFKLIKQEVSRKEFDELKLLVNTLDLKLQCLSGDKQGEEEEVEL